MFTAAEKEIMKCLWENSRPMYVEEVRAWLEENLGGKRLYKTVQSILTILLKKGYIQYEKRGRRFYYTPTVSKQEFLKKEMRDMCDFWYNGSMDKMILAFMRYKPVSLDVLKKLEVMVKNNG